MGSTGAATSSAGRRSWSATRAGSCWTGSPLSICGQVGARDSRLGKCLAALLWWRVGDTILRHSVSEWGVCNLQLPVCLLSNTDSDALGLYSLPHGRCLQTTRRPSSSGCTRWGGGARTPSGCGRLKPCMQPTARPCGTEASFPMQSMPPQSSRQRVGRQEQEQEQRELWRAAMAAAAACLENRALWVWPSKLPRGTR